MTRASRSRVSAIPHPRSGPFQRGKSGDVSAKVTARTGNGHDAVSRVWPLCTGPGRGAAVRTTCVRLVNRGLPSHDFLWIDLSWLVTYDEVSCDAGRSPDGLLGSWFDA